MIFSPHPDDETFGCGGTIVKKISEGCDIYVTILTDGRFSHMKVLGITDNPSPEEVKALRKNEVINALKILGVPLKNIFFLNYIDSTLKNEYDRIKPEIIKILSGIKPDEIYVTYRYDGHLDHIMTNKLVYDAVAELGINSILFEYSILNKHSIIGPIVDKIKNLFYKNMVYVNISQYLSLKILAINELKSQKEIYYKFELSDKNEYMKLNEYEVFYTFSRQKMP